MPKKILGHPIDEEKWKQAKTQAEKEGQGENYAYIMSIYKKMAHLSEKNGVEKSIDLMYTKSRKMKLILSKDGLDEFRCGVCGALLFKGLYLDKALIQTKCRRCGNLIINF